MLKQNDINLPSNETMRELAQFWHEIDTNEKKKFEDLAREDKERYLRQKDEFLLAHPNELSETEPKRIMLKSPGLPIISLSTKVSRPQSQNSTPETGDIIKIIFKQWRSLSKQESSIYKERVARDKNEKIAELEKQAQGDSMNNAYRSVGGSAKEGKDEDEDEDKSEKVLSKPEKKVKSNDLQGTRL